MLTTCLSRRALLAIGGAAAVAPVGSLSAAGRDPLIRKLSDVQAWIEEQVRAGRVVGAAVSVARDGAILWERGFGLADRARGTRATATTPFGLASVTKPFVTAAVMASALAGKIDVDAPVEQALPFRLPLSGFAVAGVTPRRLGSHSSGLPSLFKLADIPGQPPSTEALAREFGRLAYSPGAIYEYCNTGFQLLGAALSHVEQAPFEAAIHRRIIRPMGLRDSFFLSERSPTRRSASRYAADGTPIPFYTTATPASGELCSSVRDLSIFAAHIMGSRHLFSPAALTDMRRPVFEAGDGRFAAFGWMGFRVDGELVLVKNGSDPGVGSQLTLLPERGVSIAVVTNTSNDDFVNDAGDRIASLFIHPWRRQSEDLPSRVAGRRDPSWFTGRWRGTISNDGLDLPAELRIGPDGSSVRIGEAEWMRLDDARVVGGAFTGQCAGRISGESPGTLHFRLLEHSTRQVGRVLERRPNSTLPYIVDLARV